MEHKPHIPTAEELARRARANEVLTAIKEGKITDISALDPRHTSHEVVHIARRVLQQRQLGRRAHLYDDL